MVIAAVLVSIVSAAAVLYMSTIDAWIMVSHLGEYISPELSSAARVELRANTIKHVVEIIDGYLLATVLLIFALGLYELFISKIDEASSDDASKILIINSLDDLKSRLAKVILMILIVRYFEHALNMKFDTPLDLLYFAGGIALLGFALFLTHTHETKDKRH